MNLHASLLPEPAIWWVGNLAATMLLIRLWRRVAWRQLTPSQISGWLGACTLLAVLWQLSAGIKPGLDFHLLGASALCLIAGRDKALIGLAAVVLANCANGHADWVTAGWTWLLMALPAAVIAEQVLTLSERLLPPNYFSYFFANAFFGAALGFIFAACMLLGFLALTGAYTAAYLVDEALPYYLLMGWSEAFTTGMVMAVLVIYRPQWVESFDDRRYLTRS
jgi:uncharacterized membrane protein